MKTIAGIAVGVVAGGVFLTQFLSSGGAEEKPWERAYREGKVIPLYTSTQSTTSAMPDQQPRESTLISTSATTTEGEADSAAKGEATPDLQKANDSKTNPPTTPASSRDPKSPAGEKPSSPPNAKPEQTPSLSEHSKSALVQKDAAAPGTKERVSYSVPAQEPAIKAASDKQKTMEPKPTQQTPEAKPAVSVPQGAEGERFPTTIEKSFNENPVKLRRTGSALRKKFFANIYWIASYAADDYQVGGAKELAGADVPKCLHLVIARDLTGEQMASAIRKSLHSNYPEPQFESEMKRLYEFMAANPVSENDQVWLIHCPQDGFCCEIIGKGKIRIENKEFSQAVWDIYFGKNNLGLAIQRALLEDVDDSPQ